ncbi:MAG: SynChlorMet cassette protein ScmC [Candidatus Aminicenantes bacterium]|nr:SynChlorMet cassette protein ScmC [Candidatus Aminicenantes bacterium]
MANDIIQTQDALSCRAYRLSIGPLSWQLRAGDGVESWLARLARILELDAVPDDSLVELGDRRIYFVKLDSQGLADSSGKTLEEVTFPGCPRTGWRHRWFYPVRLWIHPETPHVICETIIDDVAASEMSIEAMVRSFFPVFEKLVESGGLPLHAALVSKDGFGVALAASGGTGKSTCARRIPAPWRPMCDDTALLVPSGPQSYQAHPFATWSDYLWKRSEGTWRVSSHVPLKGIFLLKQAEEDKASAIGQGEAAIYLSRATNDILMPFTRRLSPEENRAFERRVFDNACRLAKALPAFILEVRLEGEFWKEIERVLG